MNTTKHLPVSEAARRLGVTRKGLTDALNRGRVSTTRIPLIAGRRLIPVTELPQLRAELRQTQTQKVRTV